MLVIHYTADDFDSSLATLTDKQVSSHYLVPAVPPRYNGKPRIWQLVPEQELAWHAGISAWRGATRLNDTSIGIELENRGWQKSSGVKYFAPFEQAQIQALIPLAKDIIARYHIKPENVVAHGGYCSRSAKTIRGRYSPGNNWRSRGLVPGRMRTG